MAKTASGSGRIPAIILTILPLLCMIPAFILSTYSSSSKDWTWRQEYDHETHGLLGTVHRAPFQSCQLPAITNATDNCVHTNTPGGLCDENSRSRADNQHFCRELALGGRLLYSGNALLAASLLFLLLMTASTLPQILKSATGSYLPSFFGMGYAPISQTAGPEHRNRHNGHAHVAPAANVLRRANNTPLAFLTLLTRILAALSALLLLLGGLISTNTLVNLQYPIGDWYTTGNSENFDIIIQDDAGPWLIGKAVGMCSASAVLAGLAAWFMGLVWEGPSVGIGADDATTVAHVRDEPAEDKTGDEVV